ncbi:MULTISPECIES: YidH family protein [Gordonia]|uniref:DUF202 domain-containing protein n=1 Tax=Gordonia sputi NBRC 100414 TaxID=1089453 RepID=H5TVU1_9ACTN|nr:MULTISPECIES: DUF202 domain-containing protein [Gordonia]NKY94361.1 DUF202 domain-containing protein [Gordonia sputi]OBA33223.1 hypothetical protein A5766_11960 [Gordonia sp. 852002-51296_SCH5728562-b]GAB37599.1 hypothetical protein GOSPT_016_00380 [Gordonia sputi NBRC 100414]
MPENATNESPFSPPAREPDYRFTLANERTFLAWQRTALGLLAAAIAALQFLPDPTHPAFRYGLGLALGLLAVVVSAGGLIRWKQNDDAIRREQPLPRSSLIAVLGVALTVIAAAAVITALIVARP